MARATARLRFQPRRQKSTFRNMIWKSKPHNDVLSENKFTLDSTLAVPFWNARHVWLKLTPVRDRKSKRNTNTHHRSINSLTRRNLQLLTTTSTKFFLTIVQHVKIICQKQNGTFDFTLYKMTSTSGSWQFHEFSAKREKRKESGLVKTSTQLHPEEQKNKICLLSGWHNEGGGGTSKFLRNKETKETCFQRAPNLSKTRKNFWERNKQINGQVSGSRVLPCPRTLPPVDVSGSVARRVCRRRGPGTHARGWSRCRPGTAGWECAGPNGSGESGWSCPIPARSSGCKASDIAPTSWSQNVCRTETKRLNNEGAYRRQCRAASLY